MDPNPTGKIPNVVNEATSEPTPSSDAEKIRLKRLAKLQQQFNSESSSSSASNNAASSAIVFPKSNAEQKNVSATTQITAPKPTTITNTTNVPPSSSKINITRETTIPATYLQKTQQPVRSFEDWQNDAISKVLQITLDKSVAEKNPSQIIYLNSLVKELKKENPEVTSFKLNRSNLENALYTRLSIDPNEMTDDDETLVAISNLSDKSSFDYLLDCWKRTSEIKRSIMNRSSKNLEQSVVNERIKFIDDVKDLIVNYAVLAITYPETFSSTDFESNEGMPREFVQEFALKVENDNFVEVFAPTLIAISAQMRIKDLLNDYLPLLNVFANLTDIKPIAARLFLLPSWNPHYSTPRSFELESLLGPFCRISVFPMDKPKIAENYFGNLERVRQSDIDYGIENLRIAMQNIQKIIFRVFNNVIRSDASAREAALEYFGKAIKLNEKRAQMQVDPLQVGTDGFLVNLTNVLLDFADPFMDAQYSKIDRIDIDYFRKSKRIDISQATKINANQQDSESYYSSSLENTNAPNFISEIFFLTIAIHHYGPLHCFEKYNNLIRDLSELQKQYDRMKAEQANWIGVSLLDYSALLNEGLLKRCKEQLEEWASHKFVYDSQLLNSFALSHSFQFYNLVMNWVLRIVDPEKKHPQKQIQLPLPPNPPEKFTMLPEYIIEDITEFFLFVSKYNTRIFLSNSCDEILIFIITFLKSPSYIKNPYLKAKFIDILYFSTLRSEREGSFEALLNTHPISLNHLMAALMQFYVEVEQTGAHTQFYDKFNIRYNISQIFKTIWKNNLHKEKLKEESRKTESFVRFVNLLMNDATFLLDESLKKLIEIHEIQIEMDNKEQWDSQPQNRRQEREALLKSLERQATSYMGLGNETVHMLKYMTSEVVEPFLTPEIVDRLAAMLDYNIVCLVGPRCIDLKVKDPDKYRFQPKKLLSRILTVFLNLCKHSEFIYAVARDGRSYKKEMFSKAAGIMNKFGMKSDADIKKLEKFVNEVEEVIREEAADEKELGDIPDEFMDPIMCQIMKDPVTLPESKQIVDRSTITTHLLSDPTDPFNRRPLKIEQVIPNTELKERINAFINESKRQKK
nr:10049_t:CDS:10 [Entrophospora candida]